MKNEKKPKYFISYASTSNHSFIIITKQVTPPESPQRPINVVIASFGLYGELDRFKTSILLCGGITENGRIRSDHFILGEIGFYERRHLGVKSFEISREQALLTLKEVKSDSEINQIKKSSVIEKNDIRSPFKLLPILDQEENKYYLWFRTELNKNQRGGPNFNARDFNCKKYSIYILRRAGIYDRDIEVDRYPGNFDQGLRSGYFSGNYWASDLNIVKKNKKNLHFPRSHHNLFNSHQNPIDGSLAILKDYAEDSLKNKILHPKRHYRPIINEAIRHIENNRQSFNDIKAILIYLKDRVNKHRDMTGSLHRRLQFLLEQSRQLDKKITDKNETKEFKTKNITVSKNNSSGDPPIHVFSQASIAISPLPAQNHSVEIKQNEEVKTIENVTPKETIVTSKNTYSIFNLRNAGMVVGALAGAVSGLPITAVLGTAAVGGGIGYVTQKLKENCGTAGRLSMH